MPREIHPFVDKQTWLELRAKDLTSTEVAVLFGKSPYMTLPELWDMKRNQQVQVLEENERMFWGTRLQDGIMRGFAERNGWTTRPMNEYIRDPELRIGSSFDYELTLPDSSLAIGEVKNVDYLQFVKEWVDDAEGLQAPVHIELQVQHQMMVSGHEQTYICALVSGNTARIVHRGADADVQGAMKYKIDEFWKTIEANQPPALEFERDADFILSKYRQVIPKKCVNKERDANFRAAALAYTEIGKQIKGLQEQRKGAQANLVFNIGDAEKALCGDFSVTSSLTKEGRGVRVNWKNQGE